jgi:EmrB/QacA subfamily drug resistance transporter
MPRKPPFEYKWVVAVIFVVGLFMEILDTTIVNVAIPTLAHDFRVTGAGIEWVVLGYLLSIAVWIPSSGWIGDRFGTKKTFLFALFMFTLASMLCGQAHSIGELIAFRLLQGVGGGMLTPVGTAMLYRAFPPEERARASTVLIIPTVVAPALGPIIGGLLIDHLSWRWIFYVNVPIGLAGFIFGALYLRESKEETAGSFDIAGFLLAAIGLASFLYALSQGPDKGWVSTEVLATGVGGVALLIAMVWVELRVPQPMLSLRLYRDRMFRNSNMVNTFSYASFAAFLFLLPQFLQSLLGYTALKSGLTTFPQAVGVIVTSQFVGRLYHTVGPRRLATTGLILVSVSNIPFLFVTLGVDQWSIRGLMLLRGVSMAFAFVPLQAATYANIDKPDTGRASAIFTTQRQASAAIGVALLSTLFISRRNSLVGNALPPTDSTKIEAYREGVLGAFHYAFAASIALSIIGALYAWFFIVDKDAAPTMNPRPRKSALKENV